MCSCKPMPMTLRGVPASSACCMPCAASQLSVVLWMIISSECSNLLQCTYCTFNGTITSPAISLLRQDAAHRPDGYPVEGIIGPYGYCYHSHSTFTPVAAARLWPLLHGCRCCCCCLLLQGSVPLHWPLVNAPGRMVEQLGRQELELKRKEDALEYKKRQPGYRSALLLANEGLTDLRLVGISDGHAHIL